MLLKELPEDEIYGGMRVFNVTKTKRGTITSIFECQRTGLMMVAITWDDGLESSWFVYNLALEVIE